jgi:hypothetical protein
MPPVSLQKAGLFRHTTLGTDIDSAVARACEWNIKLDAHRGVNNCISMTAVQKIRNGMFTVHGETTPAFIAKPKLCSLMAA